MKKYVSAIFTLAILSLVLVSCAQSNKPTKDPVPEQLTSINDMYDSFKSCLSLNYAEGMTVTFKREDRTTEDFTVNESFSEYDSEEGESVGYASLWIESNNWEIDIELYAEGGYGETYEGAYISIAGTSTDKADYECEPQIIHSKDKIYLKDEATGQYICVLQKGVGIIYLEDNAGHTWNAL